MTYTFDLGVALKPAENLPATTNLQFEVDIIVDKSYNRGEVLKNVIKTTEDFISVDKHKMGDNIYISELTRQISTINGVTNLIELRVYNIYSDGYSNSTARHKGCVKRAIGEENILFNWKTEKLKKVIDDRLDRSYVINRLQIRCNYLF